MSKNIAPPMTMASRIIVLIKQGFWTPKGATRPVKTIINKSLHRKKYSFWIRKDSELADYNYVICPSCRGRINLTDDTARSEAEAVHIMSGFCNCNSPYMANK